MATATTESKHAQVDKLNGDDPSVQATVQQTDTGPGVETLSPQKGIKSDMAEDVIEDSLTEEAATVDEEEVTTEEYVVEDLADAEVDEDTTEEDAVEDLADAEVDEDTTEADAVEDLTDAELDEDTPEEDAVKDLADAEVDEDTPEEDAVEDLADTEVDEAATEEDGVPDPAQAEAVEGEGDVFPQYCEQLNHRLDDELSNLDDAQEKITDRLQAEDVPETIDDDEFETLAYAADISQERADVLAIVRSLERQTDTSSKLNDIMEGEIDSLKKQLVKEKAARIELETQLAPLETDINAIAELREENTSLKEAQARLVKLLDEIRPQLDSVTESRDLLTEEVAFAKKEARELASAKDDLELQVKQLEERLADTEHLRAKVAEATDERQVSVEQVRRLMDRLEEANRVRDALEADLDASHEAMCQLQKERQKLKDAVSDDGSLVSNLRKQLLEQSTKLAAANKKVQQETAARRQTEEMLREIKSRLVSLSNSRAIESALDLSQE